MSESYVHEEVILTCTSGFQTSKLNVQDRGVTIAKGKKIATEKDKPTCFACKWTAVLAAAAAAILLTVMAAPFLVGVLAAFLIGMSAQGSVGNILCWLLLRGSQWSNIHPTVKIKGERALIGSSELTCLIGGGDIQMFFSPAMAQKQHRINLIKNTTEVLGAAFMGKGLGMFVHSAKAIGFAKAGIAFVQSTIKWTALGYLMSETSNSVANVINYWGDEEKDIEYTFDDFGKATPFINTYNAKKDIWLDGSVDDDPYTIAKNDYQKPFTEPLDVAAERKYTPSNWVEKIAQHKADQKMASPEMTNKLQQYQQNQRADYIQKNPVHQYKNRKNKKLKRRQWHKENRRNGKARRYAEGKRDAISNRMNSRTQNTIANSIFKNFNYAVIAAFFVSDVISKTLEKRLDNEVYGNDSPENQAKSSTKVFAQNV
ncbi:PAAR-like protein [Rapidithrix thailandica]|uniref:PAAR-like protein n=1 Tax=Rapidithrix thailandica TaxID=413964 RepID=A0AAW9SG26_9BACT